MGRTPRSDDLGAWLDGLLMDRKVPPKAVADEAGFSVSLLSKVINRNDEDERRLDRRKLILIGMAIERCTKPAGAASAPPPATDNKRAC